MNINIIIKLLLLIVPAGLFLYFDEKLLISDKVQTQLKITSFLGLFAFITISLLISAIIVATISMVLHIPSAFTYGIQSVLMGLLLGLFSNIQKIIRRKTKK